MLVQTVLGPLAVHDPPAHPGAAECWAAATAASAVEMCTIVARLPDRLRPSGRLLSRAWCGDQPALQAVQAIETGLSALAIADASECTAQTLAEAHALGGDDARGSRGRLLKVAQMLSAGNVGGASAYLAGWQNQRAGVSHPLASVGAFRAHTGLSIDPDAYPPGSTIEVP